MNTSTINEQPRLTTSSKVRVAVVQAAPIAFDTAKALQSVANWTARAADSGAEMVVFPEAFVGGYPKGYDFGVTLGKRTPEGREEFRRYFDGAIDVPGPATNKLGAIAKGYAVTLVVGVIERDGGTLYCTALMFGADGVLLGKHRKLMPTALERVVWGSGDGSTLPVIETTHGKIGSVICWENYMPLLRMGMYAKGVELYCAITVDDRDTWQSTVRHIAMEGRCFVLSACACLRSDQLTTANSNDPPDLLIRGGSCIIGPLGEYLAGPVYGEETVLIAELDRRDLARGKFDFDVVGHYARPDIFQLRVNESVLAPVIFEKSAD